jgi:O-antigen ligase
VSIYTVYLFIGSILKTHLFLLPGTQNIQYVAISGLGTFIRNSTFKEGNIFGGYMVSSLLITLPFLFIKEKEINLFSRKIIYVIFFFQSCALFISYSTVNILAFIITYLLFFKITYIKKLRVAKKPFYAIVFFCIAIIAFLFTPGGKSLFYEKLIGTDNLWSYSRKDRTNMALTALKIANDNPIFGVGPTNYGFYYNDYSLSSMRDVSNKRIAGNIYTEILCESGLPGLICYILFLFSIIRLFITKKKHIPENYVPVVNSFFCGFVGMLIAFIAFSTFTLTFHWVLMGLLLSSITVLQTNKEAS